MKALEITKVVLLTMAVLLIGFLVYRIEATRAELHTEIRRVNDSLLDKIYILVERLAEVENSRQDVPPLRIQGKVQGKVQGSPKGATPDGE